MYFDRNKDGNILGSDYWVLWTERKKKSLVNENAGQNLQHCTAVEQSKICTTPHQLRLN